MLAVTGAIAIRRSPEAGMTSVRNPSDCLMNKTSLSPVVLDAENSAELDEVVVPVLFISMPTG